MVTPFTRSGKGSSQCHHSCKKQVHKLSLLSSNLILGKYILLHFLAILFIFHWNITFIQGVAFLELHTKKNSKCNVSMQVSQKRKYQINNVEEKVS
jgi:hypothetical protein